MFKGKNLKEGFFFSGDRQWKGCVWGGGRESDSTPTVVTEALKKNLSLKESVLFRPENR